MAEQLRLTFNDFDGDPNTTSFRVDELAIPADYASWEGDVGALATQLDNMSIGYNLRQEYIIGVVNNPVGSAPSPVAQGTTQAIFETKEVSTEKIYTERLPMPDLTMADDGSGNPAWIKVGQGSKSLTIFNPAHSQWTALKTAYDVVGVSPNGLSTTLERIYIEE